MRVRWVQFLLLLVSGSFELELPCSPGEPPSFRLAADPIGSRTCAEPSDSQALVPSLLVPPAPDAEPLFPQRLNPPTADDTPTMNAEPSASDDLETEVRHARDGIVRIKALAFEKNFRGDEPALKVIRHAEQFLQIQVEQGRQAAARL